MKCPACKYEHTERYGKKQEESVIGVAGDFFYLPKKRFERTNYNAAHETNQKTSAFSCPSCGICFIDVTAPEKEDLT
jgi:uncharacterized RmlC-like cupin family protein